MSDVKHQLVAKYLYFFISYTLYYNGSKKRKYYVSCKLDIYDLPINLTKL